MAADSSLSDANGDGLSLPRTCGIAFKEWSGVCDALVEGRQSLIVRKGGIAEGPRGFVPEHDTFWLYPTHVHEAEQGLRSGAGGTTEAPPKMVSIDTLAVVDSIAFVDHEQTLAELAGLHVWTDETLARRFHYRKPGLWVLGVRIFRSPRVHHLELTVEHAGCKTWVALDPPLATDGCAPVLDLAEFARSRERLAETLKARGRPNRDDAS